MVRIWPSYCQGPQVQSLVRELRSHKPSSAAKKKIEWKYKVLLSKKEKKNAKMDNHQSLVSTEQNKKERIFLKKGKD